MIKIFVDAHVFDGEFQGTRTYIYELYNCLKGQNDIHFYFGAHDIENLSKYFTPGSNITFVKYSSQSKYKRLLWEIPRIIHINKIDIAHFQYIAPLWKNCKTIVTIHDLLFLDFPENFSLKYRISKGLLFYFSAKRADFVTTVSLYSKKRIAKHFNINTSAIQIVPNGVGEQYFYEYDAKFSQKYIYEKYGIRNFILYVSRIEPRKNHVSLVKLFPQIQAIDETLKLVFIGHKSIDSEELNDELNNISDKFKKNILFFSGINEVDLLHFYKSSRLCCYPSLAEGFGIPPLESGALRIPTVCSNATAMEDFYFFDRNLFDPISDLQLFNCIETELKNPSSMSELNQIADHIREKYTWEKAAEQQLSVILKKA